MELRGSEGGWGQVRPDGVCATEMRRVNREIRREVGGNAEDAKNSRGPLGRKHDVGEGRLMSVSEIMACTGLGRGAVYARIAKGTRGEALLELALGHRMPAGGTP